MESWPESIPFKGHSISDARREIQNQLSAGTGQMVEQQDWQVDRTSPEFVQPLELVRTLEKSDSDTSRVLHLGMGDGTCNLFFRKSGVQHVSFSAANRHYYDPRSMIEPLVNEAAPAHFSAKVKAKVAIIMRDELLFPASMESVTAINESKLVYYELKDFQIRHIFAEELDQALRSNYSAEQAGYNACVRVLQQHPELLVPSKRDYRRVLTRLATERFFERISESEAQLLDLIKNDDLLGGRVRHQVENKTYVSLAEVWRAWGHRILGDFLALPERLEETGDEYNLGNGFALIEGCRSDAFLHQQYAQFLLSVSRYLEPRGVYISDGIVSAHNYSFHVSEFISDFLESASDFSVEIVIREAPLEEIPPIYLAGIIVQPKPACHDISLLNGFRKIKVSSVRDLTQCDEVLRQIAWTELYQSISAHNDNEMQLLQRHPRLTPHDRRMIDIERLTVTEVLDTVASLTDQFGPDLIERNPSLICQLNRIVQSFVESQHGRRMVSKARQDIDLESNSHEYTESRCSIF